MGKLYIWDNDEHTDWIWFYGEEIYVIGYNPEDGWIFTHYSKEEANNSNVSKNSWILGSKYPLKHVGNLGEYGRIFITGLFKAKLENIDV